MGFRSLPLSGQVSRRKKERVLASGVNCQRCLSCFASIATCQVQRLKPFSSSPLETYIAYLPYSGIGAQLFIRGSKDTPGVWWGQDLNPESIYPLQV